MNSKMVVLTVEDEPLLLMNAVSIFEDLGFDVVEAIHADEAIAILESRSDIRVVFSDVHMPGSMDGLKLVHYIHHRWPPVRLITTSGKARLSIADLPVGGVFLPKPYSAIDLGRAIQQVAAT